MKHVFWIILSGFLAAALFAQEDAETASADAITAYVKIINACETSLAERWRAGLDFRFKKQNLATDVRIGEQGPYRKVEITGRDRLLVYRHGESRASLQLPANLENGGFYTLVLTGLIGDPADSLKAEILRDYPLGDKSASPEQARVTILNAVAKFPVSLSIGEGHPQILPIGTQREITQAVGQGDLAIWFKNKDGEPRKIGASLQMDGGETYTVVIYPSAERPDRPAVFRFSPTLERRQRLAHEKYQAETAAAN